MPSGLPSVRDTLSTLEDISEDRFTLAKTSSSYLNRYATIVTFANNFGGGLTLGPQRTKYFWHKHRASLSQIQRLFQRLT